MKSIGQPLFWLGVIFCITGLFIGLAIFFRTTDRINQDSVQSIIDTRRKFPAVTAPDSTKNVQNTPSAKSQNTQSQNAQIAKPKSTSTTKTS